MIIFISETAQVKELKGQNGMDLFMNIMGKVSQNRSSEALIKFNEKWKEFLKFLPEKKVVLKFSPKPQPPATMNQIPRYPDNMSFGKVRSWRGEGHIAMICKGTHPLFRKTVPTMGMIQAQEAKYTTVAVTDPSWKKNAFSEGTDVYQQSFNTCLLYTSPSPRDATLSRMPSSA